jgi:hypothetical protein
MTIRSWTDSGEFDGLVNAAKDTIEASRARKQKIRQQLIESFGQTDYNKLTKREQLIVDEKLEQALKQ